MRLLALFACLGLAACNSPSPAMRGAATAEISIAGSTFAVWRQGDEIEVLRLSAEAAPDRRGTLVKALAAIQLGTGCGIRAGSVSGDQAVIRAELDCDGTKPPITLRQVVVALDCEAGESWRIEGLGQDFTEVDCTLLPAPL